MRTHFPALLCAASLALPLPGAETGFTHDLLGGGDLSAFGLHRCEAAVEGGALVLKSGNGLIHTLHRHGDFVLELEWRARKAAKWDSGIYIRSDLPAEGKPWPDRYQINLAEGDVGRLVGTGVRASQDLVRKGEWNRLVITARGKELSLEMNGKPAWKHDGIESPDGFIGLQSEVPAGGEIEFRNVKVTETGFAPIFNGKDLSGWQGATTGYSVENGSLVCRKEGGGNLYTEREYSDFSVRFDFKLEPGGNNGLGIRAPLKDDPAYHGMEIQILDDGHAEYKDIAPWQAHGSIYGVVAARRGHLRPAGRWNSEEVICRGRRVQVFLNGAVIVDADIDEASTPKTLDGRDHPGLKRAKGHLGFLGHGHRVEFRNLRLRELTAQAP
jgi:hypothetical protein